MTHTWGKVITLLFIVHTLQLLVRLNPSDTSTQDSHFTILKLSSLATLEAHNSLVSTWIEKFSKVFETPNAMECCIFFLHSSKLNETIDNAR